MASRWKHDRPMSRAELAQRFSDDAVGARHLFQKRWPNGFVRRDKGPGAVRQAAKLIPGQGDCAPLNANRGAKCFA
jgi:hypothetical protein